MAYDVDWRATGFNGHTCTTAGDEERNHIDVHEAGGVISGKQRKRGAGVNSVRVRHIIYC